MSSSATEGRALVWLWVVTAALAVGCASTNRGGRGGDDDDDCENEQTDCDGECVDTATDAANCGDCGTVCPSGLCQDGACAQPCPAGTSACDGTCVDLTTDDQHCGSCTIACGAPLGCNGGTCSVPCEAGLAACGGSCVDTFTDPLNCGTCGNACGTQATCQSGSCATSACGSSFTSLGTTVPQTVTGNTTGGSSLLYPTCTSSPAPEKLFAFTAPSAGMYTFDLTGSAYDTVMSVLDMSCTELACNDDYSSSASTTFVQLAAGQQVLVLVDGYAGSAGQFTLSIHY